MSGTPECGIVVCADDAGWDEASDALILRHARAGQVSAVSVLVNGHHAPGWRGSDLGPACALGLHLSLTWSPRLGSRDLAGRIVAAFRGRLARAFVEASLGAQLRRFEALFDRPPDFVDGHQHVQVLPGVREPLLQLLTDRYGRDRRPLVRVPRTRRWRGFKAASLNHLGANRLATELRARAWVTNTDFAGAYDMARPRGYRRRMQRWLATIEPGGLIMAHPGSVGLAEHGAARAAESAYFAGPDWPRDLERAGVRLIPFTAESMSGARPVGDRGIR